MSRGFRRVAVLAGSAALAAAGVAGCGSGSPATATAAQQSAATPRQGGGPDSSALAKQLGVTTAKLEAAMQKSRPGQGDRPDDLAASLAKELGLSTAKVKAALAAVRPSGAPPAGGQGGGTPPAGAVPPSGTTSS